MFVLSAALQNLFFKATNNFQVVRKYYRYVSMSYEQSRALPIEM